MTTKHMVPTTVPRSDSATTISGSRRLLRQAFRRLGLAGMAMVALLATLSVVPAAHAEDGYDLWLRYRPLPADSATTYRADVGRRRLG